MEKKQSDSFASTLLCVCVRLLQNGLKNSILDF